MNQFCKMKGILRQFSVASTPQQNRVAERRSRTLIEAARTMLADSKLPTTLWVGAVNTACYVQNKVLVVKPHNKTPYELFHGRTPTLSFMRPFGCLVTILNTLYHLGKFNGKADEGFFVGYSMNSKSFRVLNSRKRIVEENLWTKIKPKPTKSSMEWKEREKVGESSPNPTTSNPKRRNRRRSKQPFSFEESPLDTMADQCTMAKLLCAPTEGYAKNDKSSNEISNFQQHFDESFHEAWDRYKDLLRACAHYGFTELHQLDTFYNALNPADQDSLNSAVGGNLLERRTQDVLTIIEKIQAFVKAIEEICVTCGGAHPYYRCLAADGNTFLEFWDNIQGYVSAAAVNYNQDNFGYRPPSVANQIRPPGFAQPNLRNEMETTIQASMSNQTNELKNMMASFFQINTASTSGSGPLPSNTIPNPKGELKAITTKSGLVLDGPFILMPHPFINLEEDERSEETLTDPKLAEYTIKVPPPLFQKAKPNSLRNYVKKLGLPELISTRMTLELANRAICTPAGIARDVFVLVGKFTFPADFVIVDYESDPRVSLILGRPFLRTARALIDIHGEEMILRDGDERLTFNMRHDTSSYSNQPHKESINMINICNDSYEDYLKDLFATSHSSGNPTFSSHINLTSLEVINPLSGNTTSSSPDHLLEESSDFLPSPEYDSFSMRIFRVTIRVTPDKNVKKISISNASLILEDFNPSLYELHFHKEVLGSETLLSFSSENEEKVFKPEILTYKGVYTFLLSKLSHRGPKLSKSLKFLKARWIFFLALMERTSVFWMFHVSISIPHEQLNSGGRVKLSDLKQALRGYKRKEIEHVKDFILLPLWSANPPFSQDPKSSQDDGFHTLSDSGKKVDKYPSKGSECRGQEQDDNVNSTKNVNAASTNEVNVVSENISNELLFDPNMPALEYISTFNFLNDHEDDDEEADMNNMDTTIQVKDKQKKDKIGTKPDKNGKRGEAGKSQKQLQSRKKEKLKKMQVEEPKCKILQALLMKGEKKGLNLQLLQSIKRRGNSAYFWKL
nr:retrovirus-related Pol polyprotein from transposon TNT 1-94 [Tanacetum cinerariifolium]